MNKHTIIGVVLAGGKSSRMGTNKQKLQLNNISFLDLAISYLEGIKCSKILINANNFKSYGEYVVIQDDIINLGPISGIHAVLNYTTKCYSENAYIVFLPVDMPSLHSDILLNLLSYIHDKYVAYNYLDNVFPFILQNTMGNLSIIINAINKQSYSLKKLLIQLNSYEVEHSYNNQQLDNINYYEDYMKLLKKI